MTAPFTTLPDDLERRFWWRNHKAHWQAILASMKLTTLDNRYMSVDDCRRVNVAIQAAVAVLNGDDPPTPPNDGDPLWRMYERGELFGGETE